MVNEMKCTFCGKEILVGTGKMVVKIDGTANYFCNSKCESNYEIRNPRQVKWTDTYRKDKVNVAEKKK